MIQHCFYDAFEVYPLRDFVVVVFFLIVIVLIIVVKLFGYALRYERLR